MVEIETERLLLRGWRDGDIEPYASMCADPEVMRFIREGSTLTRDGAEEQISRFLRHWDERGFGLWAVEEKGGGTSIGFAGLAHQENSAEGGQKTEVGWRLDRAFWGRGLATEAQRPAWPTGWNVSGLNASSASSNQRIRPRGGSRRRRDSPCRARPAGATAT
jgi:RimJ/RimL family protein N-acetyltransferase